MRQPAGRVFDGVAQETASNLFLSWLVISNQRWTLLFLAEKAKDELYQAHRPGSSN